MLKIFHPHCVWESLACLYRSFSNMLMNFSYTDLTYFFLLHKFTSQIFLLHKFVVSYFFKMYSVEVRYNLMHILFSAICLVFETYSFWFLFIDKFMNQIVHFDLLASINVIYMSCTIMVLDRSRNHSCCTWV